MRKISKTRRIGMELSWYVLTVKVLINLNFVSIVTQIV
jgi:hypothetical protein